MPCEPEDISFGEGTKIVYDVIMEPTMILALDPEYKLHQLWKDRFSNKTEWKEIGSITTTEQQLGIKR